MTQPTYTEQLSHFRFRHCAILGKSLHTIYCCAFGSSYSVLIFRQPTHWCVEYLQNYGVSKIAYIVDVYLVIGILIRPKDPFWGIVSLDSKKAAFIPTHPTLTRPPPPIHISLKVPRSTATKRGLRLQVNHMTRYYVSVKWTIRCLWLRTNVSYDLELITSHIEMCHSVCVYVCVCCVLCVV